MIGRCILAILLALGLSACGSSREADNQSPPRPALWELASADGTVEGWLFGTIHALPAGTKWETELLDDRIALADSLIVEIAALEDSSAISGIFARLSQTPGLPPLSERLPSSDHDRLNEMLDAVNYSDGDFTATESWAAALMLAQGQRSGDPENGVDRAILRRFQGKSVRELEGAERQLSVFDRLPETDQRDLLAAVVREGVDNRQQSRELAQSWRQGDMARIARENSQGMLADPELRAALLVNRNEDWARQLSDLLPQIPPAFVAVGAAHMAGPEGLPALMAQRGYRVRRIQ